MEDFQDSFASESPSLPTSNPYLASLSVPAEAILKGNHDQLFAPLQALESSPPPPDLSLPDLPFTNSSSPPDSPSPQATQNATKGATTETSDTPKIRAMLVDGESPGIPNTLPSH
jgi:hypothetical protein